MNKSDYVIQWVDNGRCPECGLRNLYLLCHKTGAKKPMFYICRTKDCYFVGEVGKGKVEYGGI